MPLFRIADLKSRMVKNASTLYAESVVTTPLDQEFDIFLSHSYEDKNVILNLIDELRLLDFSVYVDWIVDPELDRTHVTKETARRLRTRLKHCKSLVYATSANSSDSKWMPWELGYSDGRHGRVSILPLANTAVTEDFAGIEYLEIYPYITKTPSTTKEMCLWVNRTATNYIVYKGWLAGHKPTQR